MALGLFPNFRFADIFLPVIGIPFGEMIGHILLHTQCLQAVLGKSDTFFKFLHHLIRSHDQMSLGDRKLTHSGQAMHLAGILVPEKCGSLAVAQRQIPVGML